MKKEELIKGKWYKVSSLNSVFYKFDKITSDGIKMLEYFNNGEGNVDYPASNHNFWEKAIECTDLSFLSEDHPDLNLELIINNFEIW